MPAKQPATKKKSKAEKKRLKKAQQAVFCWYCEREFEDAKVLLQHQKAKHFRCAHCPRRLNTAGGLAVHIDQVHKLPTDRIENALPGRDTFDVEIYGMEGVPANDLADWKRRKAEALGLDPDAEKRKRPRIFLGVIPVDQLKIQLEQHRALMSGAPVGGAAPPPSGMPIGAPAPGMAPPPGSMPMPPPGFPPASMPPPGMFPSSSAPPPGPPGSMPFPPPGMSMPPPPPGMALPPGMSLPPPPPGMTLPPGMPFLPPPGLFPPGLPPPPGFGSSAMPPPGMPAPAAMPDGALIPSPATPSAVPPAPAMPPAAVPIEDSKVTLKPGQVLLYGDNEVSMEEKRARQPRYHATPAKV